MPRIVKMFGPGEGLREVLLCDPADIVLGGLGRWWEEDVPAVVTDVPAAVVPSAEAFWMFSTPAVTLVSPA